ncbi:hypothetical protein MMC28_003648 [Mycoblastus sanguinarius]|nr:hypothetical protein [Mycoblastus sanguinarius]
MKPCHVTLGASSPTNQLEDTKSNTNSDGNPDTTSSDNSVIPNLRSYKHSRGGVDCGKQSHIEMTYLDTKSTHNHNNQPYPRDDEKLEVETENMSLAIMMKLSSDISLLEKFLNLYKTFDEKLGTNPTAIVSPLHHRGFIALITSTMASIQHHVDHLRSLRFTKQQGNPTPKHMEWVAIQMCKAWYHESKHLTIMDNPPQSFDMSDEAARASWLATKSSALGRVTRVLGYWLHRLHERGIDWKEKEVGDMTASWVARWDQYAGLETEQLKRVGWIKDVGAFDTDVHGLEELEAVQEGYQEQVRW